MEHDNESPTAAAPPVIPSIAVSNALSASPAVVVDAAAAVPPSSTQTPEERLQALELKTAKWKEAVATQLNDAAHKNKKLREELRVVRDEKEAALHALRVQLTEEFQERTSMQREELAELSRQAAQLREEKKTMAAAHETELQNTRVQLRGVIQLEVETQFKRKEEQWAKEKATLQVRAEAEEKERVQAEHEADMLKVRLSRLGAQYEELASLLQPKGGSPAPSLTLDAARPTAGGNPSEAGVSGQDAAQQQSAANAAFTQQIENVKAELQSKELHTQFVLERAKQEHEAEKAQLLRELQMREEELKVAHTLLTQVQAESSGYLQRVSHAQTERQALEQRFAAKVAMLSEELRERMRAVDEAQTANRRLQEQLCTAQQQVATLEEESTMREEAFHSLMLSEDNKRLVMDLQKAVQVARDEAEGWKMQYYTALGGGGGGHASGAVAPVASASASNNQDGVGHSNDHAPAVLVRTPDVWQKQLAEKEASLKEQAEQLEHKAHLLEAAETKLNDMRRSIASQASLLLQQQQQKMSSKHERGGGGGDNAGFGEGDSCAEDGERDMLDASPIISTAASLLPTSLHGSLRTLEGHRRRLHLPGSCRCMSYFFSGGGTRSAPLRLRRKPMLLMLMILVLIGLIVSMRAV